MTSETVTEEETAEEVVEEVLEESTEVEESTEEVKEPPQEETVPVKAHVAERKKRQEAEQRATWLEQQLMTSQKQQQQPQEQVDENDLITAGSLNQNLAGFKQQILEEAYMQSNPAIIERIRDELPGILSDPSNQWLADSIKTAVNRLERSAQILEMFTPEKVQKRKASPPDRSATPKSPQAVSKTNKLSIADRIMDMSDSELEEWRVNQKRKVR